MRDGSDAIADWPVLNALLNASAGATWVSVHHGGGVGIGYSLHAGMVIVADGSADADARLERVLTCDPGIGVVRHADAGYPEAIDTAHSRGIRTADAAVTAVNRGPTSAASNRFRIRGRQREFGKWRVNILGSSDGSWARWNPLHHESPSSSAAAEPAAPAAATAARTAWPRRGTVHRHRTLRHDS